MGEINPVVIINHFQKLNKKDKVAFRQDVLEATGMSYPSFYNKMTGKSEFSKSEVFVISKLIGNVTEN